MAEQTVTEQLVEAAQLAVRLAKKVADRDPFLFATDGAQTQAFAALALDRHRAVRSADSDALLGEPKWRSQCCGKPPHEASDVSADNPVGFCGGCRENTVFERAEPEEPHVSCCNDDSCACWAAGHEAGLEAQRERIGGGRA